MAGGGMLRAPLVEPEQDSADRWTPIHQWGNKGTGKPCIEESENTDKKVLCKLDLILLLYTEERMPDKEIANW